MTETMTGATEQFQLLEETLRWYTEAGVDIAIDETPHNRFVEQQAEPAPSKPAISVTALNQPSQMRSLQESLVKAPSDAAIQAAELANSANTLDDLREVMKNFNGCALKATATQMVFGDGNVQAKIMFVGEGPGREEDSQGLPFVGPAGQLLNKMLKSIHLPRTDVYIANVVPWRPPGNRTPTTQELSICKPFIKRQIELINPDILVCLGGPAAQTLLEQKQGIVSIRGKWLDYHAGERVIPAMPTFHPAYLLRQPLQKRLSWKDFQAIDTTLQKL